MERSSRALASAAAAIVVLVLLAAARRAGAEEPTPPAAASAEPQGEPAQAAPTATAPSPEPRDAPAGPGAAVPEHDAAGEEIVVTATRRPQRIRDVPAAVTLVQRDEIERSPTKTADELLRVDPSFNLFRRSSSVGADPSSQGVKLRNVGGTATSRALVLVDGIPENDAFGGWVAWRAIPRLALSRIEVVPGGGSALYGNYALGGVIQAFSRRVAPREGELSAEYGSFGTATVAGHATDVWGPVGAALDGELLRSDGYDVAAPCPALSTAEQCRGPVDRAAASEHATIRGRVEVEASPHLSFDLLGGYFWEDLNAGTRFTTASMRRAELAAGAHYLADEVGAVDLTLFGHTGEFFQERARVTLVPPVTGIRASEVPAGHQNVPTDDLGASLVWQTRSLELAGTHAVMLGADARWVRGTSYERSFPPAPDASSTIERDAGGRQQLYGVFAQDVWEVTRAFGGSLALRYDRWENLAGSLVQTRYDGGVVPQDFPDRSGDVLSPKLGLHGRIAKWLSVRAAAYRSFRGPTLDELYRCFQVGTVLTCGSPNLTPEKLRGAEAGVDLGVPRGPSLRLTGFWNELDDPIVNATIDATTRQKQNLGKARIVGLESEAAWSFARRWSVNAAYTLAATRVLEAPPPAAGQSLVGNQLAQAPKHLATASLSFDDPRLLAASAALRYLGDQYEDDQNTRPLGDALLVDLFAAWHATRNLDLFLAVENLLDKTYVVGRSGLDTIGQPRFVHGGIRIQGGG
jgi:iron complex outermembrane receptor protein